MQQKVFPTNAVQHNEPVSVNLKVFQIKKGQWTHQKCYAMHTFTNILTEMAQSDRERLRWLHNWPSGHRATMQWKQLHCPLL